MQYFGFIKEHDDYPISESIHQLIMDDNPISTHKDDVLEYLQKGVLAVSLMGCIDGDAKNPLPEEETDDSFIAYYACYTDGTWLWPQYIIEYIKRYPYLQLNPEFITHVIENKDNAINISEEECADIEREYYEGFWK